MIEGWKPGDLALCVKGGRILANAPDSQDGYPVAGRIYEVESVFLAKFSVGLHPALTLRDGPLNQKGNGAATNRGAVWPALRFCRISPLTEAERDCFLTELDEQMVVLKRGRSAPSTRGWRRGS